MIDGFAASISPNAEAAKAVDALRPGVISHAIAPFPADQCASGSGLHWKRTTRRLDNGLPGAPGLGAHDPPER